MAALDASKNGAQPNLKPPTLWINSEKSRVQKYRRLVRAVECSDRNGPVPESSSTGRITVVRDVLPAPVALVAPKNRLPIKPQQ